jgi:hypothetical protein
MKPRISLLLVIALVSGLVPLTQSFAQEASTPVSAGRETEAVVLNGSNFPTWATLGDVALKANSIQGAQCNGSDAGSDQIPEEFREYVGPFVDQAVAALQNLPDTPVSSPESCSHSEYEDPDFSSAAYLKNEGVPVDQLLGYQWNAEAQEFEQIPFQVDEMFVRYLSNDESGFSFYSETDQHTSYAFDREGFRWQDSDPDNACLAQPSSDVATDPVKGLDTDDELVFMARDAGARAPQTATLPQGIEGSYEIAVTDPANQTASFVYVMKAEPGNPDRPEAAFTTDNGYVRYERDADSNIFRFSESSYEGYGDAPKGPWQDENGVCHSDESEWKQHRPGDQATISTPRYQFRYEGRWLMTGLRISDDAQGDWTYGPDVVDQWKARAFQQRPGGETPCCGYEEEVNNWGGSSILMGERSGPVRTIRETWGADSGTNVVRREIFYRDEIRLISFLRVHVIPPGDGIYAQWDYNAGMMTKYYNPQNPDGVAIDGKNDDLGNTHVYASHDGLAVDPDGDGPEGEIGPGGQESCPHDGCINNDIDVPDPVFSGVNGGLQWEQVAGPHGAIVSRVQIHKATPGSAHSVLAVPYYRDDACFDDGTGSNPGPHIDGRDVDGDEESDSFYTAEDGSRQPRKCWNADTDPVPPTEGDPRYYQGSIGTHGIHILLIADSDNAHTTVPVTEIDSDQRIVVLPPTLENVGSLYGHQPEKPLVAVAIPEQRFRPGATPPPTTPGPTGSPTPTNGTPSPSATPQRRSTELAFTDANDAGGQYSDGATLQARLTDSASGNAISGEEVTFELVGSDGTTTWNATTDGSGVATKNIDINRAPGSYQLTARFAGDDSKLASADESSFAIDREDTDLTLDISETNPKPTLKATLVDRDSGSGLSGQTIELFAGNNNVSQGTATTNGNGVATFTGRPGNRNYTALYAGDAYYLASSAQQRG